MHSMQEFKQTGQWLDRGLSHIIMIILVITMIMMIMDIHLGSNTHTRPQTCHPSHGPARAVSSERDRQPGTVPEYKQSHRDHRGMCISVYRYIVLWVGEQILRYIFYVQFKNSISFIGHTIHNLQSDDLKLPIGHLVCIFCRI